MSKQPNDSVWKALLKRVTAMEKPSVRVGVFASAGDQDGVSLAEIAACHEFGTATIPERSFLRSTFFGHGAAELKQMCSKLTQSIVLGKMDEIQALELLGTWAAAEVKKTIRANIAPALAPATIAAKKSSLPLVDTGGLIASITHIVES